VQRKQCLGHGVVDFIEDYKVVNYLGLAQEFPVVIKNDINRNNFTYWFRVFLRNKSAVKLSRYIFKHFLYACIFSGTGLVKL
jgi:hypothetical protein